VSEDPTSDVTEDPAGDVDAWVKVWDDRGVYQAAGLPGSPAAEPRSNNRFVVSMFPYPSGDLHMGHAEVYSISDAMARYQRLKGFNVLNGIGWDSFGLPAENAAIKRGLSPKGWTYDNIAVQKEGFRRLGIGFDWRTLLHTSDPEYYRWNQWLFIQMYKRGLAYRNTAPVNWCPNDLTVLANEQVVQGRCERCGAEVVRRNLTQWFFKITDYAQRLLDDMEQLKAWPDDVLSMQRNWIGRSTGAYADFKIEGVDESVRIFTTRADTIYGATFFVVAADSDLAERIVAPEQREALREYAAATRSLSEIQRMSTDRPKTGVSLGRNALNPVTGELIPVYAADYVLSDYGTGAIMAVPAHDQRDLDFAKAFDLPVRVVIGTGEEDPAVTGIATSGSGTAVNSGPIDGLSVEEAKQAVVRDLEEKQLGTATTIYRLRDWLISRQRYWGTPIPMIHCAACGIVPVPEDQLPVVLPESGFDLRPTGGEPPLASATDWVNVPCPECGGPAKRDVDTMDTFVDSSWYFLRYPDPTYDQGPFNPEGIERFLPVDDYIGGKEHAILHLLYARFITKVFHDLDMLPFDEPFRRLTNQGQVIMAGKSMSKTLGNLVNLQEQIAQYGSDAVRVTMLFAGPPEDDIDWATVSPAGALKWLSRIKRLAREAGPATAEAAEGSPEVRGAAHRLIHDIDRLHEDRRINVAIARMMELTTLLRRQLDESGGVADKVVREGIEALARMLSVVAPFTAEAAWSALGNEPSVTEAGWPEVDPALLVLKEVTCVVQVAGKVRARLQVPAEIDAAALEALALAAEPVVRELDGRAPRRVIVRQPNLVNIVP
jgi:leucyl-tRNA synthetase